MESDEIHRETGQICEITEPTVKRTGLVSVNGFAAKADGCLCFTGDDLYAL